MSIEKKFEEIRNGESEARKYASKNLKFSIFSGGVLLATIPLMEYPLNYISSFFGFLIVGNHLKDYFSLKEHSKKLRSEYPDAFRQKHQDYE